MRRVWEPRWRFLGLPHAPVLSTAWKGAYKTQGRQRHGSAVDAAWDTTQRLRSAFLSLLLLLAAALCRFVRRYTLCQPDTDLQR